MQNKQWCEALPAVYNCYTIIKETERLVDLYHRESEKCKLIAGMLENSMKGKNRFVFKIDDPVIVTEMREIGIKVERQDSMVPEGRTNYIITWNIEDIRRYISK